MMSGCVIVGGGQAAIQVANALRSAGYEAEVTLVADEPYLPYRRPPLSKSYLLEKQGREALEIQKAAFYERHAITLRQKERVVRIDREARDVRVSTGDVLSYEVLVLATGAENRALAVPGADLPGVFTLRTIDDVDAIRRALDGAGRVVVVGAGLIGMEFAAVASALGLQVTVVEAQDRPMQRAVGPEVSDYLLERHRGWGVAFRFNVTVSAFLGGSAVGAVRLSDGEVLPADVVLVAVGVRPRDELAKASGLAVADGIMVDSRLRTSDPAIYAIGDCVCFPAVDGAGLVRIESVQNAVDQASTAAANICGSEQDYRAIPWFWSEQRDIKLQMVGLQGDADGTVLRGNPSDRRFSVVAHKDGRIQSVVSVNQPKDHIAARRLFGEGRLADPAWLAPEQISPRMPAGPAIGDRA